MHPVHNMFFYHPGIFTCPYYSPSNVFLWRAGGAGMDPLAHPLAGLVKMPVHQADQEETIWLPPFDKRGDQGLEIMNFINNNLVQVPAGGGMAVPFDPVVPNNALSHPYFSPRAGVLQYVQCGNGYSGVGQTECLTWTLDRLQTQCDAGARRHMHFYEHTNGYLKAQLTKHTSRDIPTIETYVHRIVCHLCFGPPPNQQMTLVIHSCNNTACVNPDHVHWATEKENKINGGRGPYPGVLQRRRDWLLNRAMQLPLF